MSIFFNSVLLKVCFFVLLSFVIKPPLSAQNSEIGLVLGGTAYRGDIEVRPSTTVPQMRLLFGGYYRYNTAKRWRFRAQLVAGQLYADEKRYFLPSVDNWRERRGISFKTTLVELSLLPEWRVFTVNDFDFYVFTGVAGFYFKPTTDYNEPFSMAIIGSPNLDKNATFSNFSAAIPVGGGVQWHVNDKMAIGLEASGRKTFADYVDGLSKMAEPKVNDNYFFINLTFSMLVNGGGKGVVCPKF